MFTGRILSVLFILISFTLLASVSADTSTLSPVIAAMIQVESGDNDYAFGDTDLDYPAYGCLQIRQPCVDDVNESNGTHYRAEDCLGNRELSLWIHERYLARYATAKRLGHKPTDQDRARIWNKGPDGYKDPKALKYWKLVKKVLK